MKKQVSPPHTHTHAFTQSREPGKADPDFWMCLTTTYPASGGAEAPAACTHTHTTPALALRPVQILVIENESGLDVTHSDSSDKKSATAPRLESPARGWSSGAEDPLMSSQAASRVQHPPAPRAFRVAFKPG